MIEIIFSSNFIDLLISKWLIFLLLALSFYFTMRSGFVNLGISCQLIFSAIGACYIYQAFGSTILTIVTTILIAFFISLIPIFLKIKFRANEILTTLFLTFLSIPLGQYILKPTGDQSLVATPPISNEQLQTTFQITSNISIFHVLVIVVLTISIIFYLDNKTSIDNKSRVMRYNHYILSKITQFKILSLNSILASISIGLIVLGDIIIVKGRYTAGDYDSIGFIGIVITFMAAEKIIYIPLTAIVIALLEMIFILLKVMYGVPQAFTQVIYGVMLIIATFYFYKSNNKSSG